MPEEYASRAKEINQQFLCITDHGMMGAIPEQIRACDHYGVTPLFGVELYVNPLQIKIENKDQYKAYVEELSPEDQRIFKKSFHLLAIAYNNIGYENLVRLSSWGWAFGQGGRPKRPRVNHEILNLYKEGIVFTSCCYNSEVGQAFDGFFGDGGDDAGFAMIEKYMAMFGENYRLEMMLLDFDKQKPYDKFIIKVHDKYNIPVLITQDCHYCYKEDSKMQRLMLMVQTGKTIAQLEESMRKNPDQDFFELQDTNLWMKSEEEINEKWERDYQEIIDYEIFKAAKANTVKLAEQAKGVEIDRSMKLPSFPNEDEVLKEEIIKGFKKRQLPKTKEYLDRIREEYDIITRKGFSSYFLIKQQALQEARRIAPLIMGGGTGSAATGPARGSGGGSLVNFCLGITQVDPVKHGLLFSRFLSEARGGKQLKLRFTE